MAQKRRPKQVAVVDEQTCTGCQTCLQLCPRSCIVAVPAAGQNGTIYVVRVDEPRCVGCTLCHQVCPGGCISMESSDQRVVVAGGTDVERG